MGAGRGAVSGRRRGRGTVGGAVLDRAVTLLIADDDAGFRRLLRRLLEQEPDTRVLGEAADGEEAVRLAQQLRPRIVLMDIGMPRLNGLEAIRRTKAVLPDAKIVVVTVHGEDAYRRAAEGLGADAVVLKKALVTDLLPTIRRLAAS